MFYIKFPDGNVALHMLEDIVITRLEYLEALYQNKSHEFVGNIEYLLEDSNYDSIGHFLLRQLNRLLRRIIKHINEENKQNSSIDNALILFSSFFLKYNVFYHIVDNNHMDSCEQYHIKVNFELIPNLVKYRDVKLYKGQAIIYCYQWKEALISLFETFISNRIYGQSLIRTNLDILTDPRLISLNLRVQNHLQNKGFKYGNLTFQNINIKETQFPLCMRNLHIILRQRHRLTHHARFYYTLFLKECGMKIEDVIEYWKEEYSKPHLCGSTCTHNWQHDERKFVYSIRHMYGLEGNKRNYKAQNCNEICKNIPGPNFEGGCPFKNFDLKTLHKLLSSYLPESKIEEFLINSPKTSHHELCKKFFLLSNNKVENNFIVTSPVQYFMKHIDQNY